MDILDLSLGLFEPQKKRDKFTATAYKSVVKLFALKSSGLLVSGATS